MKKSFASRIYILKTCDDAIFANKKRKALRGRFLRRKIEIISNVYETSANGSGYYFLCYSRHINEHDRPNVGAQVMSA